MEQAVNIFQQPSTKDNSVSKLVEVFEQENHFVANLNAVGSLSNSNLIFNVLIEQDHPVVHEDSLYEFHVRIGYQRYTDIEELAAKPESGTRLNDHEMPNCIVYAEGRQTRNNQAKTGFRNQHTINRIGGVFCSDLKGPITPTDRNGNRYMINFIDYKTNYCRAFLIKTKDKPQRSSKTSSRGSRGALTVASKSFAPMVASNTESLRQALQGS
jgi:hypothetical protein